MTDDAVADLKRLSLSLVTSGPRIGAVLSAAIRKTAYDIEADAKALAPVDTGNLRASISTTITGDGRGSSIQAEMGPTAEYGAFVEEGTSRHAPQPYMAPAFERRTADLRTALLQLGALL